MRWVDREDWGMPARLGLRPGPAGLGLRCMTMGWVVADPTRTPEAGINPAGWGGLTVGIGPDTGGV